MCGLKSVNHFLGYLISGSALSSPFQLLGHVPRERAPFETPNSPFKQCGESILALAFFAYILFDFYTPFPVEIYEFLLAVLVHRAIFKSRRNDHFPQSVIMQSV